MPCTPARPRVRRSGRPCRASGGATGPGDDLGIAADHDHERSAGGAAAGHLTRVASRKRDGVRLQIGVNAARGIRCEGRCVDHDRRLGRLLHDAVAAEQDCAQLGLARQRSDDQGGSGGDLARRSGRLRPSGDDRQLRVRERVMRDDRPTALEQSPGDRTAHRAEADDADRWPLGAHQNAAPGSAAEPVPPVFACSASFIASRLESIRRFCQLFG